MSFDVSQNNLVFDQGVDNIQALVLTGTSYSALSANAKPAFYLSRWNQRLYEAFTIEGGNNTPFRVRWPVNGDHTNWTGNGSGFVDLNDDVYQIRNIKKWMDTLAVYTERGIIIGTKTPAATGPAQFQLQVKDVGLFASYTLVAFNTVHFFLGTDNVYLFDGTKVIPIGNAIRSYLFAQMQPAKLSQYFGVLFTDSQEYGCFVYTAANVAADTAWMYHYSRNAIYPWRFATPLFSCAATHLSDTSVTISQLVGQIGQLQGVIGSSTLSANFPIPVFGGTDGRVYFGANGLLSDDGVAILCRWTSKDYVAADIDPSLANYMVTLKSVGVQYVDPGTAFTLQFSFSVDKGNTWTGPYALSCGGVGNGLQGDAMLTQQVTGKRVRFKIENNTTNENPQIISFSPVLEQRKQLIA
jgi:hypothetical protein